MANTPQPHLPMFRMGDLVLFEVEVRDAHVHPRPRFTVSGVVTITIRFQQQDPPLINQMAMTRVSKGLYQYTWQSPATVGMYTAEMVANHGGHNQQSQTYALVKLVA